MSALIAAARRYVGVPFRHRGRGPRWFDCVGLVWRAYRDAGVELPCPTDYGREPQADRFMAAIVAALGPRVPKHGIAVGDVVTLRTKRHPHHIAIVTDHPEGLGLIHASGEHGRVVEHRLDADYRDRIVTVHRRPV
jgi:cell wall-associated NlpC family hydrolase